MRSSAALRTVVLLALATAPAPAEVLTSTFASSSLGREVSYVVDVPPSYDGSGERRYPVVYALHGLFEGSGFWERRGLAFGHGAVHDLGGGVRLFCSFHVSQQNTFTGRLTPRSFDAVLAQVKRHLARG